MPVFKLQSNLFTMHHTWPTNPLEWTDACIQLMKTEDSVQFSKVTLQQVTERSEQFPIEFPVDSVRCKSLIRNTPEQVLERNINSAYPVVHEAVLNLYSQFLEHKKNFGSSIEKKLYQNMTLEMLIDRLLNKRAVVFVGPHDKYVLMDGFARVGGWEKIGKAGEEKPLILENHLSYDEIKLAALLSVSSYTQFINIGDRNNCGRIESNTDKITQDGIIIGLIGARFEKQKVMEYQEIIVTKEQNTLENGYGDVSPPTTKSLFLNFYGELSLTYEQLKDHLNDKKFTEIRKGCYFNNIAYEKRLALSFDTLLIEANARAEDAGKMAFIHVVGIGLGVWKISQHQEAIFMDTFAKRIEFFAPHLNRISGICFSYIKQPSCGKYKDGDVIPIEGHEANGIRVHIFNRDPHDKLEKPYEGNLLIVSYAWDGNALPGNEFWLGQLAASGDPAAAASTQIAELHNPHINPKVCGANLKVATLTGLVTFDEYRNHIKRVYDKSNSEQHE